MEFIIDNIWLIGLVILSGGGLLWSSLQGKDSKLTLYQATQLINKDKADVLDVRPSDEFAQGHMPGAKNIPLVDFPQRAGELNKLQSKSVIVVCNSGMQSLKARSQLKKLGINDVFILEGGLSAWQSQGLPTTK